MSIVKESEMEIGKLITVGAYFGGSEYTLREEVTPLGADQTTPVSVSVATFIPKGKRSPFAVFVADHDGRLHEKRPISYFDNDFGNTVSIFRRGVPVIFSDKHECYTTIGGNNSLHVVSIDSTGRIEVWQVAVVSQEGQFFGKRLKLFADHAVWDAQNESVDIPGVEWPQLKLWLLDQFKNWEQGEDGILPEEAPVVEEPLTGGVKWYNLALGLGVVMTPGGDVARVHWTQAPLREEGLRYLLAGETIVIGEVVNAQQVQKIHSDRQTGFQWEARQVELATTEKEMEE